MTVPRRAKILIAVAILFLLAVFFFTYPGKYLLASASIHYYDFILGQSDFQEQPFDESSYDELDNSACDRARACIARLGKLDMTGETIAELGNMSSAVVPLLVEAMRVGNPATRYQAALALGLHKDPETFGPLVETLLDGEGRVRMAGAIALGNLEDDRAQPYLIKCLKMQDKWARFAAAKSLAHLGSLTAVVALGEMEDDPDLGDEASQIVAEFWKRNGTAPPLIEPDRPLPACIVRKASE